MDYIEIVRVIRDDLNKYKSQLQQLEVPKMDKTLDIEQIAALKIKIETLTDILNKIK